VGSVVNGKRLWIVATAPNCSVMESLDLSQYIEPGSEESFRFQHTKSICEALSQDDYAGIERGSDVIAEGLERLKAIGNCQCPKLACTAWKCLSF